jgi:hypothetical protein
MNNTEVQWIVPAPLWESISDSGTAAIFSQPAILRFASDNFMNEFATLLQTNPDQLKDFRARRETWRGPDTTPVVDPIDRLPKFAQKLYRSRLIAQKSAVAIVPAVRRSAKPPQPVKLYQPAHQRYYLISAGLVCQIPGQPDRHIETSNQERVTFVVRKVVAPSNTPIMNSDPDSWTEYAFVNNSWLKLEATSLYSLVASEEQNPLFAMMYTDDSGHRRRVLAGLVPVGKREAYIAAPQRTKDQRIVLEPGQAEPPDPRTLLFMANVTEPWKRLIERAAAIKKFLNPNPTNNDLTEDIPIPAGEARDKFLKESREQMQTVSWYVLLDFAKLLRQYIPNVWATIMDQSPSSSLTSAQSSLVSTLTNTQINDAYETALKLPRYPKDQPGTEEREDKDVVPSRVIRNMRDALKEFRTALTFDKSGQAVDGSIEHTLETIVTPYDRNPASGTTEWPDFLFPLADPELNGPLPPPAIAVTADKDELTAALEQIDNLANLIESALPLLATENVPPPLIAAQPVLGIDAPTYFVIRCVFERPNCGPLQPTVVSEPTEPFAMAGFFDPDAPARPLRINLPVDTTPAGLRKFDKNTAFMISDILCSQIERAKGLGLGDLVRSVLPWPLHKDLDLPDKGPCTDDKGLNVGMICSLSIPIITICALILLMIIVSLLDIIFRWMPFFIMCLPLPKFNGKQANA